MLSKNLKVVLNDKNKARIQTLKNNLKRLNLNAQILNQDFIKFNNKIKYDVIVVDAPCSAVGTIRRNPEIFFKNKEPNFKELLSLQENMLEKASFLLNTNGFIIYMTCSFLKIETIDQVKKFIIQNNNFLVSDFEIEEKKIEYSKLIKNNFMITIPNIIFNYNIDGYFAAFLKKIK